MLKSRPAILAALSIAAVLTAAAQIPPAIQSVITAGNFGGSTAVAPGSWVEIHGSNLAAQTQGWTYDQFLQPHSTISVTSVQVSVAGKNAFVSYTSPSQINVRLAEDVPVGLQQLIVTDSSGASAPFSLAVDRVAPALWSPSQLALSQGTFVGAFFPDGSTYVLPPGAGINLKLPSRYAQPGDTVTLYAVGLGPLDTASKSCLFPLRVFFGDTDAVVKSVGFGPSLPGFYRVDVIVPEIHPHDRNAVPVRLSIDGTRDFKHLLTAITTHLPTQESVLVNGVPRTYTLYVPLTYHPQESALIIGLHGRGAGGPGSAMEFYTDLDDKADREGFAVAYLDGLPDLLGTLNWNYFYSPFFFGASNPPDDVSFIRDVIDALEYKIDPDRSRIFVTGTSAGGFMAQRAGVEVSDRVAAIAAVEGGISVIFPASPQTVPNPKAPVSVLLLKGDQDRANPYCGAVYPAFSLLAASADQDFNYWTETAADQCSRIDRSSALCESMGVLNPDGTGTLGTPSSLVEKEGKGCRAGTEVKLYRLLGGLDVWNMNPMNVPDQAPFNPLLNHHTGVTTNEIIWDFFRRHPKER